MLVPPTLAIRAQRRHLANASRSFLDLCHASLDLRGPSHARSVSRRELAYGGELEELPRGGLGFGVGMFPDEFYIAAKSSFTPRATIRNAPSASGR